jgi:hypothetical protein
LAQLIGKIDFNELEEAVKSAGADGGMLIGSGAAKAVDKSEEMTAKKFYQLICEKVK